MTQVAQELFKSQYGEDRILWELFGGHRHGFFIEVGAWNGVTFSNTYFLEQMGWTGLLIEPLPQHFEACVRNRPRSRVIHAACTGPQQGPTIRFTRVVGNEILSCISPEPAHAERCRREGSRFEEIEVPAITLDRLIARERNHDWTDRGPWRPHVGWQIDLVSIDVEGGEMEVLRGFNLDRFKPKVLLIENNLPSGAPVAKYLQNAGYHQVHRQVINDFWVRGECLSPAGVTGAQ